VRRSPAAPRRQARVSALGRNRSRQLSPAAAAIASSPARSGAIWVASSPAVTPAASTTATRQGRPWAQRARSAARRRPYSAWAEAPGRPTLARTRMASTGPGVPDLRVSPGSWWPCGWSRWASRAARSAWRSGRIDTPGCWSSQEGQRPSGSGLGWGRGMVASLRLLAGGPLGARPTWGHLPPGAGSCLVLRVTVDQRRAGCGRPLGFAVAVGAVLATVDSGDCLAGLVPSGPLGRLIGGPFPQIPQGGGRGDETPGRTSGACRETAWPARPVRTSVRSAAPDGPGRPDRH
jgi:hypothetical protein